MFGRVLMVPVVVLALASGATLRERQPHAVASIAGTVYDSLVANGPLANAEVTVEGTTLSTLTDQAGRFQIDSVPAGQVVLRFYHATLDSLGFGAAPVSLVLPDSGLSAVRLATPSPTTLHASLCPAPQAQSTGVLLGRVRNVDDGAALPNATVSVSWGDWNVGGRGLTQTERRGSAVTNASGAYMICGVPTDVAVIARATAADHVTGLVEVDLGQRAFGVREFAVSMQDSGATTAELARLDSVVRRGDAPASTGTARLSGVVHGPDGRLLDQAQVALFGFPISVRTTSEGAYALTSMPAGSQTIEIRAVGFAPKRLTVGLRTGEQRTLDVTLDKAAQTLASVNIVGSGARLDNTGFEKRKKAGIGRFIGPEEIERRRVFDTSQLLWNVTGARVMWDGSENVIMFTRPIVSGAGGGSYNNLCNPAVFVDGFPVYDINDVRPYDVRGIEVYTDKTAAPPEFRSQSLKETGRPDTHCAVILVWSKPRPPKHSRAK